MAFGNISTLYLPSAANAGASQWGSDVRKLLNSADATDDFTTATSHGVGGETVRTEDPYSTSTADLTQADYGWAVTPSDMNSVAGAKRFYPAGNHTVAALMSQTNPLAGTGTMTMYVYRVGPSPGRTRTLLGSASASVAFPALSGGVIMTVTVALGEVVFDVDETVQYSFELSLSGLVVTGNSANLWTGTNASNGFVSRIDTPKLGVLADTTGTASGSATAAGVSGNVLGTTGTVTGTGAAAGVMSSTAATTGTATGTGIAVGLGSSVAGTVGTASGSGVAAGLASIVLGTVGTVEIGSGAAPPTTTTTVIFGLFD